jgi:hypothetical protein
MFLIFGKALVTQSSGSILFFKKNEISGKWTNYYELNNHRGQVSKGNVRIQVTTDERIFFYIIDRETLLPELETVMNNFMGCS